MVIGGIVASINFVSMIISMNISLYEQNNTAKSVLELRYSSDTVTLISTSSFPIETIGLVSHHPHTWLCASEEARSIPAIVFQLIQDSHTAFPLPMTGLGIGDT